MPKINIMKRTGQLLAMGILSMGIAHASAWPERAVSLMVGAPPGGTTDILARLIAPYLSEQLSQQVVVVNRGGASGLIATNNVAKARPDGYTLLFSTSHMAVFSSLYSDVPFDAIKDFSPITLMVKTPYVMVAHPELPVKTAQEIIDYAKSNPGKIDYAASSPGGGQHLAWEMFKRRTDTNMVYIPYSGTGALMTDLLAGRLVAAIDNVAVLTQYIRRNDLRGLVTTGKNRSPLLPELPTLFEVLGKDKGFEVVGWFGMFAPANTPDAIVQRMDAALKAALKNPELNKRLLDLGAEPHGGGPKELAGFLQGEMSRWGKVIREVGISPQSTP